MPRALRIGTPQPAFDVERLLRSKTTAPSGATYQAGRVIFSQGDVADSVIYLRAGLVKLSVLARNGKEAVIAVLEPRAFFGENALVSPVRKEVATAITATTVLIIPRPQMIRLLHEQHEFSDRFLAHALARNVRIAEDVADQLLNSSEKRLARVLLLLAHPGIPGKTYRALPPITQQTLADMVGTTRSRVNSFMAKFKKLGYIDCRDGVNVNESLATVISCDERVAIRRLKLVRR
jgi:CRP/FNR family transcriptional regulator, cyclic AMP receptor protein